MSRLPLLAPEELSAAQKPLFDTIAADSRRMKGREPGTPLSGPFNALLYSPEIGQTVQELGAKLRFESSLPGYLRELAILTVAQRWRANYEWFAHAPIAEREGLASDVIAAIKQGDPLPDAPKDVEIVRRFASELLNDRRVSDETYEAAREALGESGLVELVSLLGYYGIISGLLNAFNVPLPDGEELPFPD